MTLTFPTIPDSGLGVFGLGQSPLGGATALVPGPGGGTRGSFNGLTFGGGLPVGIDYITGFKGLPPVRSNDPAKTRADGSWPTLRLMGSRTITLGLDVADSMPTSSANYDAVANAFNVIEDPNSPQALALWWPTWDNPRVAYCFVEKAEPRWDLPLSQGLAIFDVQLVAPDPLIYDSVTSSGTATIPRGQFYADVTVTNTGNYPTDPFVYFFGPMTDPRVTNETTGEMVQFNLSLAAGDYLAVDFSAKNATWWNGSVSKSALYLINNGSQWFDLAVGDTVITFANGDASYVTSPQPSASILFQSAWAFN